MKVISVDTTAVSDDRKASSDRGSALLAERARSSGLLVGTGAVVVVPAWTGFDRLLEPDHASLFLLVRLGCAVPMLLLLLVLWLTPLGRRRPQVLTWSIMAIAQAEVAWMVPRATDSHVPYLLGLTLVLYASGCLFEGRPRWTGALVAQTWLSLGIAVLAAPDLLTGRDLAAGLFHLVTASLIGLLAHAHRHVLAEREGRVRARLEQERDRTRHLLVSLERLSHEDPLTGLANRRRWDAELEVVCAAARVGRSSVAVVLIDFDRFKDINDRYGHAGGDEALRRLAALLTGRIRSGDLVARLGGDELGVLLPGSTARHAVQLAEQLRQDAQQPDALVAGEVALTLSLGVAAAYGARARSADLVREADRQLYRAKRTRNAVCEAGLALPVQTRTGTRL